MNISDDNGLEQIEYHFNTLLLAEGFFGGLAWIVCYLGTEWGLI